MNRLKKIYSNVTCDTPHSDEDMKQKESLT